MANLTRILNNQIYSKTIIASQKIADGTITGTLFSSNVTVPGDLLISGNLFVLGTSAYTTIASTNTYVNDPLIVMNNGFAGTNIYDEGLIFNRGSLLNQAFLWSEVGKEFRLIGTTEIGTTYGNVSITNFANLRLGNLTVGYTTTTGNLITQTFTATTANISTGYFETLNVVGNVLLGLTQASAINNTPIGNSTPSTAAFTTLTASGITTLTNTSTATGIGSGALQVSGGASINGNLWIGGNLNVLGNSFTVTSNAGVFYGDVNGFGAIYVGVAGYTPLPQTVVQSSANFNGYAQNNFENLSSGTKASTDWVATAGNGTDTNHYIDTGITSPIWDGTQDNSLTTALKGNDGYLYVQGDSMGGGNLVIGTSTADRTVGIIAGGNTAAFVVATFNQPSNIGTTPTTGVLTLAGGLGVSGNINQSGSYLDISASNALVFNTPATVDAFKSATDLEFGATSGTLTINNPTVVGTQSTQDVFNTTATTVNAFGAATAINIGSGSAGALTIRNTQTNIVGVLYGNNTTPSTTIGTGGAVFAGGVGIAGNVNVGGNIRAGGPSTFLSTLTAEAAVTITDTTQATNTTSGALKVRGGASFAKDVYIGGNLFVSNIYGVQANVITVQDPLVYFAPDGTFPYDYDIGFYSAFTGTGLTTAGNVTQFTGLVRDNGTNTWTFASNLSNPSTDSLLFNGDTVYDPIKAGNLQLTVTTDATNATSGALIVAGGAGIGGNIFQTGTQLQTSAGSFIFATTPTTVDAFKAATDLEIGATSGTMTINNPTVVGTQATQALYNTAATIVNFAGSANVTMNTPTGITTMRGNAVIQSVTESTSPSTGALKVSGGAGIAGNIFQGGTQLDTSASNYIFAKTPTTVDAFAAASTLKIGTTLGIMTLNNPTVIGSQPAQDLFNTVSTSINFAGTANVTMGAPTGITTISGNANVRSVTQSTSFTNGALVVAGGLGLGSNLNIRGGSVLTLGKDIASGVVYSENAVQVTSTANTASRISLQNTSNGSLALTEFVATADTGSNTSNFSAVGITSSNFAQPGIVIIKPLDSYFVGTGNVVITATGGDTVLATGVTDVGVRISAVNTNVGVQYSTVTTSPTTGAFTVVGGVGFGANLIVNNGATINYGQSSKDFVVQGKVTTSLIRAVSDYGALIFGGSNATPTLGAVAKFNSNDSIQVPVGTSSQRPSTTGNVDVAGMLRFNTTINNLEFYDGSVWQTPGSTVTIITSRQFSGNVGGGYGNIDGTNTSFTLQSSATTASTLVSINGVLQIPILAYSVSGTTLTFTEPPAPDDIIDSRVLTTSITVSALASGNGLNQFIADDVTGVEIWTGTSTTTRRVLVDTAGNFNLLTGNKVTYTQVVVNVPTTATATLIDTWGQTTYTTGKYVIQAKVGSTNVESYEALVLTDGSGNAYVTTYGIINNGTTFGTVTANVVSGNVRVYFSSTIAQANVKAMGTFVV